MRSQRLLVFLRGQRRSTFSRHGQLYSQQAALSCHLSPRAKKNQSYFRHFLEVCASCNLKSSKIADSRQTKVSVPYRVVINLIQISPFFCITSSFRHKQDPTSYAHMVESPSAPTLFIGKK